MFGTAFSHLLSASLSSGPNSKLPSCPFYALHSLPMLDGYSRYYDLDSFLNPTLTAPRKAESTGTGSTLAISRSRFPNICFKISTEPSVKGGRHRHGMRMYAPQIQFRGCGGQQRERRPVIYVEPFRTCHFLSHTMCINSNLAIGSRFFQQ